MLSGSVESAGISGEIAMIKEERYVVLKIKDIEKHLTDSQKASLKAICSTINDGRKSNKKKEIKCVVVESDWPEYEEVWEAIAARVDGTQLSKAYNDLARLAKCNDSCFTCKNFSLCYMRRGMEDQARRAVNLLNIDGDVRPGRYVDLYLALGSACIEFNRND